MSLNYNLNVSRLNFPMKRHRLSGWIKKQDPTILSTRNTSQTPRHIQTTEIKGWKMYTKQAEVENKQE
jgi:hypothetical protein